jgi:hypothetical protein
MEPNIHPMTPPDTTQAGGGANRVIFNPCFDERGIPIEEFDVLRLFHYVAALRREKVYMYKQVRVVEVKDEGPRKGFHLYGAHLTKGYDPARPLEDAYYLGAPNSKLEGVRIVQSPNWEKLTKRPK